jgi:hypothetical protein
MGYGCSGHAAVRTDLDGRLVQVQYFCNRTNLLEGRVN